MPKEIKEGAIFISDSHYPHHGDEFLTILQSLEKERIKTEQLFLMGDIFDLLFGHNEYIKTFSQDAISLLQRLSQKLEIYYIEGNHDFSLKDIFPNIKVYSREEQPVKFKLNKQNIYLTHGDKFERGVIYNLYSKIIRDKRTITLLKPFEKQIINHQMKRLKEKSICKKFKLYQEKFDAIIRHYPKDALIIEGHFHQGIKYKNYISLPSLVCQKEVGVIYNSKLIFKKL